MAEGEEHHRLQYFWFSDLLGKEAVSRSTHYRLLKKREADRFIRETGGSSDDDTEAVHQDHAVGLYSGSSLHEQSIESSFMTSNLRTGHVVEDLTELLPEEPGTNTRVTILCVLVVKVKLEEVGVMMRIAECCHK